MPSSKRAIRLRAQKEGWAFIERIGMGGIERAYSAADLPAAAREIVSGRARISPAANDVQRSVGRPKGTDFFTRHPNVADAVEAILLRQKFTAARIMGLLETKFSELPSLRTLKRFIANLEIAKPAQFALFQDPDLAKSRDRISMGRADGGATHAHQVWELDTTPSDVMTKGGRKAVLGVIDRWSRRVRFMIADSESGQSVRRLLVEDDHRLGSDAGGRRYG